MLLDWSRQSEDKYLAYLNDAQVTAAFEKLISEIERNPAAGFLVDKIWMSPDPFVSRIFDALFGGAWGTTTRVHWAEVVRPPTAAPPPLLALAFF